MTMQSRLRSGEQVIDLPEIDGPSLMTIGEIRTPWRTREECPRQGRMDGPDCQIVVHDIWQPALEGIDAYEHVEVLYWLHHARRDLVRQNPKGDGQRFFGTFALRSPQRPNPIGTSLVRLVSVDGPVLTVRGLDCLDGTSLIDLKPDRCAFTPKAAPK